MSGKTIPDTDNNKDTLYDSIREQLMDVDTSKIRGESASRGTKTEITEKQRTFHWIRIFLKEENKDIEIGDIFDIQYENEKMESQFIAFGKKNLHRDKENIINYDPEDDAKQLCLMVDEESFTSDVKFIRSLFPAGKWYEYQIYRRSQLTFTNRRTGEVYDYVDADF